MKDHFDRVHAIFHRVTNSTLTSPVMVKIIEKGFASPYSRHGDHRTTGITRPSEAYRLGVLHGIEATLKEEAGYAKKKGKTIVRVARLVNIEDLDQARAVLASTPIDVLLSIKEQADVVLQIVTEAIEARNVGIRKRDGT
jgi:hypothetical protein